MKSFLLLLAAISVAACTTMTTITPVTFESNRDPGFTDSLDKLYLAISAPDIQLSENRDLTVYTYRPRDCLKEIIDNKFGAVGLPIRTRVLTGLELGKHEIDEDAKSFKAGTVTILTLDVLRSSYGYYTTTRGKCDVLLYEVGTDKVLWRGITPYFRLNTPGLNALIDGLIERMMADGIISVVTPIE